MFGKVPNSRSDWQDKRASFGFLLPELKNGVVWLLLGHKKYRLDPGSPAEHIHRLNLLRFIAFRPEKRGVPGQRGRIAGDIDNGGRAGLGGGNPCRVLRTIGEQDRMV